MAVKLNPAALAHARSLVDDDQYTINTEWSKSEPTPQEENHFLDKYGWDEYAQWYLGVDTDEVEGTKARYKFPYGNFKKLHHSGVIAIKQRAAQNHYDDIVKGADELLDMLDRLNAC
jgi:hypothetical protein